MPSTADRVLEALQPFNLKREKPNQYRCNSPSRPGADSMSFVVVINSPEHGSFFDHHPSANPHQGSLYDLAKLLGIPLPDIAVIESTKRVYTGMEDYAKAHGITGEQLRAWHVREVVREDRLALEIPTQTGRRWRFLDGAKNKPVYKSEPGYKRCWYGLDSDLKTLLQAGFSLLICNGEISTIAARSHNLTAIAMTAGEKGEIPHDLLEQLKGYLGEIAGLKVLIALDCDKAGRVAARGLEAQLRAEGFDALAVDLGLGNGGDLADFCMLFAPDPLETLTKLPCLPPAVENTKWQFASVDEVLKLPPIDWLIPGQIPARGLTMVYGASATYKSFFMLDLAIRLALAGVNILYIAAEGEHGYRPRLEAWIKHHKAKPQNLTFVLGQVDLFDPEALAEFKQRLQGCKYQMIVFDTLAMCSGMADENHTRDMLTLVKGCKQLSKELDTVIVLVHHTNAEGKKERGSKVLRNACDTIIRVSLEDDRILVESQKTKDAKPFQPYYLAPIVVDLSYTNNLGDPVTSVVLLPSDKVVRGDELTPLQRRVLEVLSVEPNASVTEIAASVENDHRGVISKVIRALVKKGYLRTVSGGREVTPEGIKVLDPDSGDSADSTDSSE